MENSSKSGGIGIVGAFTLLFVGLKLTGHIQWSWLWVLSPLWLIPSIIGLIVLVIFTIGWFKNK